MDNNQRSLLNEIMNKIDKKVLESKINQGIDMLKNGSNEEIVKKLSKINKQDIVKKLNEIDIEQFKKLNIDTKSLKQQITDDDFKRVKDLAGPDGEEIVKKLKSLLDNK